MNPLVLTTIRLKWVIFMVILTVLGLAPCVGQISGAQWLNLNYAGDEKEYHNLDIYLPSTEKTAYKPIIVIYGSAWFGNNMKQFAFNTLGKQLLDSGFAVIAINHRASSDAPLSCSD